jgi:hypothetical protein
MRLVRVRAQNAATRAMISAGVVSVGLGLIDRSVRADVKIVTEIKITGYVESSGGLSESFPWTPDDGSLEASNRTHTVTAYYKDKMARTETDSGQVTLYDAAAKKIYRINPTLKTYTVTPLNAALKPPPPQNTSMPEGANVDTAVDLDATRETRAVVGQQVRKYMIDGYIRTVIERPENFGSTGHGGIKTGFPANPDGGNTDSTPPGAGKAPLPTSQVGGEYWLADTSILPAAAKNLILPLLRSTFPLAQLLKPLNDKLTKLKMIPLYSQVTIRVPGNNPSASGEVITAEVKSITAGPLDDGLFKVPDDYRKVDPPATRQNGKH